MHILNTAKRNISLIVDQAFDFQLPLMFLTLMSTRLGQVQGFSHCPVTAVGLSVMFSGATSSSSTSIPSSRSLAMSSAQSSELGRLQDTFVVDAWLPLLLLVQAFIELLVRLSAKGSLGDCVTVNWEQTILKTMLSLEMEGIRHS